MGEILWTNNRLSIEENSSGMACIIVRNCESPEIALQVMLWPDGQLTAAGWLDCPIRLTSITQRDGGRILSDVSAIKTKSL